MVLKSELRKAIKEVLDDHEVEGKDLLDDLVTAITDTGDVFDDEEEDALPDLLGED